MWYIVAEVKATGSTSDSSSTRSRHSEPTHPFSLSFCYFLVCVCVCVCCFLFPSIKIDGPGTHRLPRVVPENENMIMRLNYTNAIGPFQGDLVILIDPTLRNGGNMNPDLGRNWRLIADPTREKNFAGQDYIIAPYSSTVLIYMRSNTTGLSYWMRVGDIV